LRSNSGGSPPRGTSLTDADELVGAHARFAGSFNTGDFRDAPPHPHPAGGAAPTRVPRFRGPAHCWGDEATDVPSMLVTQSGSSTSPTACSSTSNSTVPGRSPPSTQSSSLHTNRADRSYLVHLPRGQLVQRPETTKRSSSLHPLWTLHFSTKWHRAHTLLTAKGSEGTIQVR
jgi:hypothetical protein